MKDKSVVHVNIDEVDWFHFVLASVSFEKGKFLRNRHTRFIPAIQGDIHFTFLKHPEEHKKVELSRMNVDDESPRNIICLRLPMRDINIISDKKKYVLKPDMYDDFLLCNETEELMRGKIFILHIIKNSKKYRDKKPYEGKKIRPCNLKKVVDERRKTSSKNYINHKRDS